MRSTTGMVNCPADMASTWKLIEDLVAGAADESAYISSATARPPSSAYLPRRPRGGFGNRRVEQPVIRQRFGQAAIDGERPAQSRFSSRKQSSSVDRERCSIASKRRRARCTLSSWERACLRMWACGSFRNLLPRAFPPDPAGFRRPVVEAFNPAVREHDFAPTRNRQQPRTDS